MKNNLIIFFLITTVQIAMSQKKDTCYAGVYITRNNFIENRLSDIININEKGNELKFSFPAVKMILKIRTPDTTVIFKPGSIYAYNECGNVYRYSPGGELYAPKDYYKIKEKGALIIYSSVFWGSAEYFYSITSVSPIHRLNMRNLQFDFKSNPEFIEAARKLKSASLDGLYAKDKEGHFMLNKIYRKN